MLLHVSGQHNVDDGAPQPFAVGLHAFRAADMPPDRQAPRSICFRSEMDVRQAVQLSGVAYQAYQVSSFALQRRCIILCDDV